MSVESPRELVYESVTLASGVSRERLLSSERVQEVFFARMAYARIRRNMGITMEQIGRELNRDHSTVSRMVELHDYDFQYTERYRQIYLAAIDRLRRAKETERK